MLPEITINNKRVGSLAPPIYNRRTKQFVLKPALINSPQGLRVIEDATFTDDGETEDDRLFNELNYSKDSSV